MKNIHPNDALPIQVYTAYGYGAVVGPNLHETLAGFFEALIRTDKHRFGWVASRTLS
jgi:hypothetical protein